MSEMGFLLLVSATVAIASLGTVRGSEAFADQANGSVL
jgi:hypothetical protein